MVRKIIFTILVLFSISAESQNTSDTSEEVEDNSISTQFYNKCFENLNQGIEIFEKYPAFKNAKICSIMYCTLLFEYKNEELSTVAENRLRGIATQSFREGNPLILLTGYGSFAIAKNKNEILSDDNHIVYVRIAECSPQDSEVRAQEIVNKQTELLIKQSQLK